MNAGPWQHFEHFDRHEITAFADKHGSAGLLALVAEQDRQAVPDLQKLCRDRNIRLAGAIFPQLLNGGELTSRGILLLSMDKPPQYLLSGDIDSVESADAVISRLDSMIGHESGGTLFLIFDALMPNITSFLHTCYLHLADRVAYTGGNAGSESFRPVPCLFDHQRSTGGGLLALYLPQCPGGWLAHGYRLPEEKITATAAEGNRIISIDWRPPFEVYCELAARRYGIHVDRDNFYETAVHFPFGIVRANGDILVRIPVRLGEDGSLHCIGEIPANALLTLLEGPAATLRDSLHELGARIGHPQSGLTFYCAGRRLHLGDDEARRELDLLRTTIGDLHGALTLGEVGSSSGDGYPVLHNAAVMFAPCRFRSTGDA